MATKNYCSKNTQNYVVENDPNTQYSNLNLNQSYQCPISIASKSVKHDNRKVEDYEFTDCKNHETKNASTLWNNKKSDLTNLHYDSFGSKEKINLNDFITIASTLSLHITAYENSFEVASSPFSHDKDSESLTMTSAKTGLNVKQIFDVSTFFVQNPFEFPRQQENEKPKEPEIAQFKASQKFQNPNESTESECSKEISMPEYIYPPSLLNGINVDISEGYQIRPLAAKDFENGFLQLLSQLTVVGEVSSKQALDRFNLMASLNPLSYYITVIEDIGTQKIVGAATLVIELKFIHGVGSRGRIEDVVVDKEKRGLGLAVVLNETLVALAKNLEVYKLSLECKDTLIPFYEKFGYKKDEGNNFLVQRFD